MGFGSPAFVEVPFISRIVNFDFTTARASFARVQRQFTVITFKDKECDIIPRKQSLATETFRNGAHTYGGGTTTA